MSRVLSMLFVLTVVQTTAAEDHRSAPIGSAARGTGAIASAEVDALADPSPARRRVATHRLRESGEAARADLSEGLNSSDLEVRLTCQQLLAELDHARLEHQLARLLRDDYRSSEIDLAGWSSFAELAGDSRASRALFASMARRYDASLRWIDRVGDTTGARADELTADLGDWLPIDVGHLNDGDSPRWALLLLAASRPALSTVPVLSARLRGGLLNPTVSQHLWESPHGDALRTLIAGWLRESSRHYVNATMLKLALMYHCDEVGLRMARERLASRHASPSEVATAMILLTRLDPREARTELERRREDTRICHVWQIVAARRRAVQTQVSDIATALLLHLEDQDPREYGFQDLEADPQTIYCEFSMGFEDDQSRRRAYERAYAFLMN